MFFWQYWRPDNLPESIREKGILAVQREIILQSLYNITLIIMTVGSLAIFLITTIQNSSGDVFRSGREVFYLAGYFLFAFFALNRRIPYPVRAGAIIVIFQMLGASALVSFGLSGTGITFLFASILLSNLLFRQQSALGFDALAMIILGGMGALMLTGRVALPPTSVQANSGDPMQWFLAGLVLVFAASILTASVFMILRGMSGALLTSEKLTRDLEEERGSLEVRVKERSAALEKRLDQFEIASQIARDISIESSLESLLNNAVNLIRDRFGFYHVGVFINDEKGEYAVLRAATGTAGKAMLERFHRLRIGETGIVGYVAARGEVRIALDVQNDPVHYKNPNLPDTRAEMALPLKLGDLTIGALDVQSVAPDAFTQEDARVLQTIADQLATAFEKTSLVERLEKSLAELDQADRNATQKAWRDHLRANRQKLAYRYHNEQLSDQVEASEQSAQAQALGETVIRVAPAQDGQDHPSTVLAVPIKLRNQILGVVDIRFESAAVSPDLVALIEGTVSRLAVSLENARLVEENQYRAERERVVGEISSKVRSATDVDSVLRVAVQEIGRSLGVSEVMVQLRKEA